MVGTEEYLGRGISFQSADDRDILFLINTIREGISYSFFEAIVETGPFSFEEWSTYFNISERTLQRYKKEQKPFHAAAAERILEIVMLYRYGLEVFEDQGNFETWLSTKSIALAGSKPKELLDTTFGVNMIRDELTRIAHGVLA